MRWSNQGRALLGALPSLFLLALCVAGCPSESSSPPQSGKSSGPGNLPAPTAAVNHPPVIRSARIVPEKATLVSTLSVETQAEDQDGEGITFRYAWFARDILIQGQTEAKLKPTMLRRGDQVQAELTPVDARGAIGAVMRTNPVVIDNTPPIVTQVSVEPTVARPGDTVRARAEGSDPDLDLVRYDFQWWRNGKPVSATNLENAHTLSTTGFSRGDTIIVGVTPHDPAGPGDIKYSDPVVLSNRPPAITSTPASSTERRRFEYVVTAADPDQDPLTFKLVNAPSGMTIDDNGRIVWEVPADVKGPQQVRVGVDDGNQGQAFQEFTITPP